MQKKALFTTLIGIGVNFLLAGVKLLGGIFGHSYALIADAIESSVDMATSVLLYIGLRWAARPPDQDHPYGHGKAEALIALGVAMVLGAAAVIIVIGSIQNIITPHQSPAPFTLIILVFVIAVKELLHRFALKTGNEIHSTAVKADAFHHRSDAITSAAAFIGISIGLIGGPGFEVADDYAALFSSLIIAFNVIKIARPAIGELLDELNPGLTNELISTAASVPGVIKVEKAFTRKMGMSAHADLHIWVDGTLNVAQGHAIAHQVKDRIRTRFPQFLDVHIHVEPAAV